MVTLTHNNHFKFGYNNNWFNFRTSPEDRWTVSYGACERAPNDFHAECLATAQLIRDTHTGPLTVLFSGGVDSEIVVRSFKELGIPIKVAVCQFNENANLHDVAYAAVCCQQLGIKFDLVQLNIKAFLDEGIMDYATPTQALTPGVCSTMWLADQVDGIPILGNGECYLVKRVPVGYIDGESPYDKTPWDMYEKERIAAWYRHFIVRDREAVPGFFQYTPEIMLSFLKDQRVVDLANDRVPGKRSTMTSKLGIYQKYFPVSDRKKYHGYETISKYAVESVVRLQKLWPEAGAIYLTEYNDLVDMLEGKTEGPKGKRLDQYDIPKMASTVTHSAMPIDETRQLNIGDYEQVIDLISERFSTVIEFDRAEKKGIVITKDMEAFRTRLMNKWRMLVFDTYLRGKSHKMFGSFSGGKLMSLVGMRLVFDNSWVLSTLRARDGVNWKESGLRQTMTMLYQHAKDINRTEYYCCVAEYRYGKFQTFMKLLVPELYSEYSDEVLAVIPAGEKPENDFWWGMMGRMRAEVNTVIKKMTLQK